MVLLMKKGSVEIKVTANSPRSQDVIVKQLLVLVNKKSSTEL